MDSALWNMGEESLDTPSPRIRQIVAECGEENAQEGDLVSTRRRRPLRDLSCYALPHALTGLMFEPCV